jgi:hypothetical protein
MSDHAALQASLEILKDFVSRLEYSPDTVYLDKRLGEALSLIYACRQHIDAEWFETRTALRRFPRAQSAPQSARQSAPLEDLA